MERFVLNLWPFLLVMAIFCWRQHVSEAQPTTVRLELGDGTVPPQILNNNSMIDILSIGDDEAGGDPLVCATQRSPCCEDMGFRTGNWYYPNGTEVPIMGAGYSFYRIRRDSDPERGVLGGALLNRRHDVMGPTGIYSCTISDPNGTIQTLYVGLYTSDMIQTTTTEEPSPVMTTMVASTTQLQATTTAEVTSQTLAMTTIAKTTTNRTMGETTPDTADTTDPTSITMATIEPTTDAAVTPVTEVSTAEEMMTDNTAKTNTMPPDELQTTMGPPRGTEVLRVVCDTCQPLASENDPLLIMVIVEGVIIAILIAILTVITVAFLHWRQKRKTGLDKFYVTKNPGAVMEQGGSVPQVQRGGTLMSGNAAYFKTQRQRGTVINDNVAYVIHGGTDQVPAAGRKPVEEMETSLYQYIDMEDKEDRMLRMTYQTIDTPVLRNQSKGHDQQAALTAHATAN